jgi:UDP-3-O-[3-hydroxymyristoyl] glucosamine N-acyltransferase
VKIGVNVEIQYNTCVDRAVYPWDDTVIGDYCKIDNLVHIAHGVKLGPKVMIVANSGIGGRTIIKEGAWIGFGATIKNGVILGKKARANMGSVVTKEIPDNSSVTGNFAIEHSKFIQNLLKSLQED